MWYERSNYFPYLDTLNFTGPTECTITSGGTSFSPTVSTTTGDSLLFTDSEINAQEIGKTIITMSWPSGQNNPPYDYLTVFLSNDSLIGVGDNNTLNGMNFTR